ncbi:MAG: tyrosine-type recombinase/integrase [Acidimicrobiales bacterium]
MTKRRGSGEGGIRQRPDGRWEGSVDLGYQDGRRRRKFVYGHTKAEVLDALRKEHQRKEHGLPPTDARRTVADFLHWWADKVLPGTVTAGSEATYRRLVDLYIVPAVGRLKLSELAPAHVTEMMRSMASGELSSTGRPLSPQTQSSARKVLGRALRRAEQEGIIVRNAATLADGPRTARREGRSLTLGEARSLLRQLETDRLGPAFGIQLALGLRRGEVLGMRWSDLDLDCGRPVFRVRRQLQRQVGVGLVLTELKTHKSRRDLAIPGPLVEALRRWRATQSAERLAAGPAWQGADDLVFTTPLGTPVDPDNFRHRLSTITEQAGLGHWHTHELRHSAGSLLFDAGVPMKLISELLGHSSERVTSEVYVHTGERHRERVADVMAATLWGAEPASEDFGGQLGGQSDDLAPPVGL